MFLDFFFIFSFYPMAVTSRVGCKSFVLSHYISPPCTGFGLHKGINCWSTEYSVHSTQTIKKKKKIRMKIKKKDIKNKTEYQVIKRKKKYKCKIQRKKKNLNRNFLLYSLKGCIFLFLFVYFSISIVTYKFISKWGSGLGHLYLFIYFFYFRKKERRKSLRSFYAFIYFPKVVQIFSGGFSL